MCRGFYLCARDERIWKLTCQKYVFGDIIQYVIAAEVRCSSVVRAFAHGAIGRRINPSWWTYKLFLVKPALHDWCNKGRGMCYPVCGMVHIKEPLLLIGKSCPCGGSGFPFSLSEWSITICPTPYNQIKNIPFRNSSRSVLTR